MAKREYRVKVRCRHEGGCDEWATYICTTRAEEKEQREWLRKYPYRCVRHRNLEEVLSVENTIRVKTLVAGRAKSHPELKDLYWSDDGSGFVYGSGFKAFADDFPIGTKLEITAKIILPEEDNENG